MPRLSCMAQVRRKSHIKSSFVSCLFLSCRYPEEITTWEHTIQEKLCSTWVWHKLIHVNIMGNLPDYYLQYMDWHWICVPAFCTMCVAWPSFVPGPNFIFIFQITHSWYKVVFRQCKRDITKQSQKKQSRSLPLSLIHVWLFTSLFLCLKLYFYFSFFSSPLSSSVSSELGLCSFNIDWWVFLLSPPFVSSFHCSCCFLSFL